VFTTKPTLIYRLVIICIALGSIGSLSPKELDKDKWVPLAYERPISFQVQNPISSQVLKATQAWAAARQTSLSHEPRLSLAADLLSANPDFQSPNLNRVRLYARYLGLSDGLIAVSHLQSNSSSNLDETVTAFLSSQFPTLVYNRVGIKVLSETNGLDVLFLFSRNHLDLSPIPSQAPRNTRINLQAQLRPPHHGLRQAVLVFSKPDGTIKRRTLKVKNGYLRTRLNTGPRSGILDVQLLLNLGHGPEISSQFSIGVGRTPFKKVTASVPAQPHSVNLQNTSRRLENLLTSHRKKHHLPPLSRSTILDKIAINHNIDMRKNQFFGHVSDRSGSVTDRLHSNGITFERVLENIATGESIESIFEQWLHSPSHRQNLLDPFVTSCGVGVIVDTGAPHTPLTAVLVLTRLGEQGTDHQLRDRAYELLSHSRSKTNAPPLRANPQLEALAMAHSQTMGSTKILDTTHPYFGNLLDRIMRETQFSESAADIYLTTNLESLTTSHHLTDVFEEVGVGVYRDLSQKNTPIWVTVIYATP